MEGKYSKRYYAGVFGISKENKVDSPIDFWQVVFNLSYTDIRRGITGKWIKAYVTQETDEDDTINKLRKKTGYTIQWGITPQKYSGYIVVGVK